ncbi:macrolide family glycosyltransferase [Spongiactinospora sp. 9N601]|uniref:macrolide family glycosyltransferase n=1 Tax=Spongiactinospora sp. 9N601 TaxID=3375149 RepID=UPI0037A433F5
MTRHFLFMAHPDHGHVMPTLAVVTELVARGHRVTYLTGDSMAAFVAATGATVLTYDSKYRQANRSHISNDPLYLFSLLVDESQAMLEEIGRIEDDLPDVIVYDISILFGGRVLARKWGVPAVQAVPMFASNAHFSYLNAIYNEEGRSAGLPGWMDDMFVKIENLAASQDVKVPPAELWWEIQDFSLVNIPRCFQIAGSTFDERFAFVGPCLPEPAAESSWRPPADAGPVALVSLGGIHNQYPEFFRMCVRAFAGTRWHIVMTVGDGMDPDDLGILPPNMEIHRWMPHEAVLPHASVAVTHGGLGTVMMAMHAGCPMVIMPVSVIDQPTARQVRDLNLGRVVHSDEITAEWLIGAVEEVVADEAVQRSLREMRREVHAAGGTRRAADELERYAARFV